MHVVQQENAEEAICMGRHGESTPGLFPGPGREMKSWGPGRLQSGEGEGGRGREREGEGEGGMRREVDEF